MRPKNLLIIFVLVSLSSCATRSIFIKPGTPVQLSKSIKGAEVWVFDKNGVKVKTKADLPEGYWVIDEGK